MIFGMDMKLATVISIYKFGQNRYFNLPIFGNLIRRILIVGTMENGFMKPCHLKMISNVHVTYYFPLFFMLIELNIPRSSISDFKIFMDCSIFLKSGIQTSIAENQFHYQIVTFIKLKLSIQEISCSSFKKSTKMMWSLRFWSCQWDLKQILVRNPKVISRPTICHSTTGNVINRREHAFRSTTKIFIIIFVNVQDWSLR